MKKLCALVSSAAFMLSGCGGHSPEDYAANSPKLDIREFLNGPVEGAGVIYSFTGKADLTFTAQMQGSWQGNRGTFAETFTYSDGRTEKRTWQITLHDDHNLTSQGPHRRGGPRRHPRWRLCQGPCLPAGRHSTGDL